MKLFILTLFLFVGCTNQPNNLGKAYNTCEDGYSYKIKKNLLKQIETDEKGNFLKCLDNFALEIQF